jgi:hypothetical protein
MPLGAVQLTSPGCRNSYPVLRIDLGRAIVRPTGATFSISISGWVRIQSTGQNQDTSNINTGLGNKNSVSGRSSRSPLH